jgi:hypothetical protein
VFSSSGDRAAQPLPRIDNAVRPQRPRSLRPIAFKLDDGSVGSIAADLAPPDIPTPQGPIQDFDSFIVRVRDARGRQTAQMPLRAAYGDFQLVPVDLIDGPGDELLVFRNDAHSSPPTGYEMRIMALGGSTPIDLGSRDRVSNLFGTRPISCARWRQYVYVDMRAAKPRPLMLKGEVAAESCCAIFDDPDGPTVTQVMSDHIIRFDAATHAYIER